MTTRRPAGAAVRRTRSPILTSTAVLSAVLVGVLGYQSLSASFSSASSPPGTVLGEQPWLDGLPGGRRGLPDEAEGLVPDGTTVFDEQYPAVARLDPALLAALQDAAGDAAEEGVRLYVNSGWRSAEYQERLLEEAVAEYGSEEEAARWVATPETSPHVSGDAVDLGGSDATAWLAARGAAYGLCRVYANEPWHYELRPEAVTDGCPEMYDDPTDDPRMQ